MNNIKLKSTQKGVMDKKIHKKKEGKSKLWGEICKREKRCHCTYRLPND